MATIGKVLKAWWPSILAAATALWGVFGTQIEAIVAKHPEWTTLLGALAVVIAHLVPSPASQS